MKSLLEEFDRLTQEIEIKKRLKSMAREFQRTQTKCDQLLELHKGYSKKNNLDTEQTTISQINF